MSDFNGPVCKNLLEFMDSVKGTPAQHKTAFETISKHTIETVCDADALHVWESDSDMDNLLQLTQVIVKLRNLASTTGQDGKKGRDPAMIIIAEEKKERDNYGRIVDFVKHLTGKEGRKHLDGVVTAFDGIVVIRGVNTDETAAVKRINIAIERVVKMTRPALKSLVWHHGPVLSLLLTWINTTTPELRSRLTGITITAALDIFQGVKPSPLGKPNKLPDLKRLEDYAKKLKVPVVFIDPGCGLLAYDNLALYMYYWAFYVFLFLPPSVVQPHFHTALDELVTSAFRIRGASEGKYGSDVVRLVQSRLDASKARRWARRCISASSYTKDLCREAGNEGPMKLASDLADCPLALYSHIPGYNLPAFSRLPICPATASTNPTQQYYFAAPTSFSFSTSSFRAAANSPFRILIPKIGQNVDTVTERIQGVMMAVLTSVMKDRAVPRFCDADRALWKEVCRACVWALEGSRGKCPKEVERKVGFVLEFLKGRGSYGRVIQGETQVQAKTQGNPWGGGVGAGWGNGGGGDGAAAAAAAAAAANTGVWGGDGGANTGVWGGDATNNAGWGVPASTGGWSATATVGGGGWGGTTTNNNGWF
ncbi:hypothetical protein K458DRAFT_292889 [Lentithecium fluviatile CBS 122367]|uniref:Uncharacterized protein n=1 Tax=Lentithecium fluviatile CBS 122367 TaxID=1168545 RepID=A0A6G1JD24_9PLEO|nr:hypothetical protein K458DRAFT_292889 [Lentithecium fluviatile CBS 122367]